MKPALALALLLCAAPVAAQTPEAAPEPEGKSLMEQGAELLLRGLIAEMEPALDEMAEALDEVGPALERLAPELRRLVEMMGDVRHYEAPVMLPNGDILIRRKADAPPLNPDGPQLPGPNGEIEL